jgi:16S rRNA (guanine(1405)-N(7))-methyltransferase
MRDLLKKIKSKRYSTISDDIIIQEIDLFLRKKPKAKDKEIIKEVKKRLHKIRGSYQIKKIKKRDKLLEQLRKNKDSLMLHKKILETNLSTKERLKSYKKLYRRIFQITGEPKTILDIGSGINPISYPFLRTEPEYIAIEIDKEEVDFINEYFRIENIKGRSILMNINEKNLEKLPKSDVCFLFKVLDPLEKKGHKFSELLVKSIKAEYLVVSFPTKTISNKKMNYPRRGWFERMLNRIGYNFKLIKTANELYYVVKK